VKSEFREDKYPTVREDNSPVIGPPFNMNIKAFKRLLDEKKVPKKQRNAAIGQYKEKVYTRVEEVKAKMEKEQLHATDK